MLTMRNGGDEESVSVSEFVMLLMILLLILIGFITSNPSHLIEFFVICVIAVIMFATYLYIKKYAHPNQSLNITIEDYPSAARRCLSPYSTATVPSATIDLLTVIMPLSAGANGDDNADDSDGKLSRDYNGANRLPLYEELARN